MDGVLGRKDEGTLSLSLSLSLTCAEHASDVGVPLVEALLHDGVDKGGSVEERPLVRLTVILLGHFSATAKRQSEF